MSRHPRLAQPPEDLRPPASARRLEWFTDGFYSYRNGADTAGIADLRIGYPPNFVFSFDIARREAGRLVPVTPVQVLPARPRRELLGELAGLLARTWEACTD